MLSNQVIRPAVIQPPLPRVPMAKPVVASPLQLSQTRAESQIKVEEADPLQRFAFYMGLAMLFIRVSVISEVIAYKFGVNTYLLYLVGPPALIGALFSGGIQRTFKNRASLLWMGFFACMVIAVPFSTWTGSSAFTAFDYARTNLPLLVVLGGLTLSWKEVRKIFYVMAAAGLFNLLTSQFFMSQINGRYTMQASGTIGNPNDLASHIVFITPFLLFILFDRERSPFIKPIFLGAITYGIFVIVGTASRGAMVAMGVMFLIMFLRVSMARKVVLIVSATFIGILAVSLAPTSTISRLSALFGGENAEAEESQESRMYLFRKSVEFTLKNPVVGVGPGQFPNAEGKAMVAQGLHGNWHATHCAFTQVSSECGIPALIFFVASLGSAFWSVNRNYKQARKQRAEDIANACLYFNLALLGYLAAISFLANAYGFYLPAMIGLAISLSLAARRELERRLQPVKSALA